MTTDHSNDEGPRRPEDGRDGPVPLNGDLAELRRKVWVVLAQVLVALGVVLLLWYGLHFVLLVFGGILHAVWLNAPARWISSRTSIGYPWAVMGISVFYTACVALAVWTQGPRVAEQASRLTDEIPTSIDELRVELRSTAWGDEVLRFLPSVNGEPDAPGSADGDQGSGGGVPTSDAAQRMFGTVMGGLLNLMVVLFLGVYFALSPGSYRRSVVALLPPRLRESPDRALVQVGSALRSWIVGRLLTMLVTAIMVAIGLYLFDVPLVLVLAVFAGAMNFVPYIGPVIGALPAVLLASGESFGLALQVAGFFWVVQIVESFVATPLIQKKAVSIPPALLVISQIFMGLVAGILGVLLATPIAVAVVVLIQTLYLKETLNEEVDVLGA